MSTADLLVVGGGPAGLAVAIGAARAGLSTVVLERGVFPLDKACGEGLMPNGVRALERLGARALLRPEDVSWLEGVRYVQEDGSTVEGRLPAGGGLGIRRLALSEALSRRARAEGVVLRERTPVTRFRRTAEGSELEAGGERLRAPVVVAADGLASPLRRFAGLDRRTARSRRFGIRQHFARAPWSPFVEVHLAEGVEAYVTPCGPRRVGLAFLWSPDERPEGFEDMLARFPALQRRLAGAPIASALRGAGPLWQRAKAVTTEGLALVGDAAGYVDAITGEGLSLAFECAEALVPLLPRAVERGGDREAFVPYERHFVACYRRYALGARALLWLTARPKLRRQVLGALAGRPLLFERLLRAVAGAVPAG